jgi:DNA-binding NarL/FixJ family response regulator
MPRQTLSAALPEGFDPPRTVSAALPLSGLTLLTVEDSRFASEAMRLLAQRSGARLRRAETMALARRHLALYRPDVVIVDLGLPDGSGAELIAELAGPDPPAYGAGFAGVLLATSGDPANRDSALAAGAMDFIPKPIETLAGFQAMILRHLPPAGPRKAASAERVRPDPQALRDDLAHAADLLEREAPESRAYVLAFLRGLARVSHDPALEIAACEAEHPGDGLALLSRAIAERLADHPSPFAAGR